MDVSGKNPPLLSETSPDLCDCRLFKVRPSKASKPVDVKTLNTLKEGGRRRFDWRFRGRTLKLELCFSSVCGFRMRSEQLSLLPTTSPFARFLDVLYSYVRSQVTLSMMLSSFLWWKLLVCTLHDLRLHRLSRPYPLLLWQSGHRGASRRIGILKLECTMSRLCTCVWVRCARNVSVITEALNHFRITLFRPNNQVFVFPIPSHRHLCSLNLTPDYRSRLPILEQVIFIFADNGLTCNWGICLCWTSRVSISDFGDTTPFEEASSSL